MKILKNKFVNNTFWMLFSQVFYLGITFFVSAYASRIFGPTKMGVIDYSNNYISILLIICSLGVDSIVIKDIVNNKEQTGVIIGTTFVIKTITSFIGLIFLNIFLYITVSDNRFMVIFVGFLQSFLLLFKLYSVFDLYYQSRLESKKILKVRCITSLFFGLIKIVILIIYTNLYAYVMFSVLEHLACLALVYLTFRQTNIKLTFSIKTAKSLLMRGYHFILSDLLVMVYTRIDKLMLGSIKGTTTLGIYSIATLLSDLWTLIPNALIASARPKILEGKKNSDYIFEKRLRQLYASIFYIGLFISIAIVFLSKFVIELLYGPMYLDASIPMIILSFSSIFALLGSARSIWIIGEGLQKYIKYYVFFGAISNIILNSILIIPLGMTGVAISTLISQLIVSIIAPLFIKKTRRSSIIMIQSIFLYDIF